MGDIIFIGGIHGSGKGYISKLITEHFRITHLTASKVLKWQDFNSQNEKLVNDINETQDKLIINLKQIIEKNKRYLLDGHYCLLNKFKVPEKVPIQTFLDINPTKIILVTAEPFIIKERLEKRDLKSYQVELIKHFQDLEEEYATELSSVLNIDLLKINSEKIDREILFNFLKI